MLKVYHATKILSSKKYCEFILTAGGILQELGMTREHFFLSEHYIIAVVCIVDN
jgi:hypothetical protein